MTSSLLVLARVPGPLVTGFLATLGSLGLAFAVMTDCTNNYSCSPAHCSPCASANFLVTGGWILQGVLFAVALALWLPPVVRRMRARTLAVVALVVPLVAVLAFGGIAWAAQGSYCRPGQVAEGYEDYCGTR
ncbi:hypothetical protein [Nocardioides pacificus]